MPNTATVFPPQTYSSTFFLNSVNDEENCAETRGHYFQKKDHDHDHPALLDCFIATFLTGEKRPNSRDRGADKSQKCNGCSKTSDKDLEVSEVWKSRHSVPSTRSESPQGAFRRWRRNYSHKVSSPLPVHKHNQTTPSTENRHDDEMSLLKFLAINALDLSAPASDLLLKTRKNGWFQLSGHPDCLAPAGPGTVWKKRSGGPDDTERKVYEELSADPILRDIIPKYYREVDYQGEKFIELQDLLHGFIEPTVIDIKMGTRTFLESEVKKSNARNDLYQKMVQIDPAAPTEEEHRSQAVTKLRYMQFREEQSSTCSLGFRIEAMKCRGSAPVTDLKTVKSRSDVLNTMDLFLGGREDIRQRSLARLNDIRNRVEQSDYFKTHEIVGSSVFMIYDDSKVGIWIIDFAKTNKVPEGVALTHREPWTQGNLEEGFLFGLDQLITVIEEVSIAESQRHNGSISAMTTVSVKS